MPSVLITSTLDFSPIASAGDQAVVRDDFTDFLCHLGQKPYAFIAAFLIGGTGKSVGGIHSLLLARKQASL
jgi:hypothetical protein